MENQEKHYGEHESMYAEDPNEQKPFLHMEEDEKPDVIGDPAETDGEELKSGTTGVGNADVDSLLEEIDEEPDPDDDDLDDDDVDLDDLDAKELDEDDDLDPDDDKDPDLEDDDDLIDDDLIVNDDDLGLDEDDDDDEDTYLK